MKIAILGWIIIFILVALISMIVFMLYSLAKQGDERKRLIKTKTMSTTFLWTIAILIEEVIRMLIKNDPNNPNITNPLLVLMTVSIIFFVSLIIYKKKYGD